MIFGFPRLLFVLGGLFVAFFAFEASAATVASHIGSADPATEGWSSPAIPAGLVVGPIVDSGTAAWIVDDNSLALGSTALYTRDLSPETVTNGNTLGWILRARVRVVDTPDVPDGSIDLIYRDGATSWQFQLGSDASGDPIVFLRTNPGVPQTGTSFTVTGAGSAFVLYELIYDPGTSSADLFVNGTEVVSDYTGFALSQPARVFFGSGTSSDTGHGNYALVEMLVPEPTPVLSGLAYVMLAASLMWFLRRRRNVT